MSHSFDLALTETVTYATGSELVLFCTECREQLRRWPAQCVPLPELISNALNHAYRQHNHPRSSKKS